MYCNKAPACCIPGPQHCANHVVLGICSHISKKPWILSNTDTNRTGHNTRPGPTLGVHVRGGESLRRRGRRKENVPGRGQSPRSSRERRDRTDSSVGEVSELREETRGPDSWEMTPVETEGEAGHLRQKGTNCMRRRAFLVPRTNDKEGKGFCGPRGSGKPHSMHRFSLEFIPNFLNRVSQIPALTLLLKTS